MATRRRGVSLFLQGVLHRGLQLLDAEGALQPGGDLALLVDHEQPGLRGGTRPDDLLDQVGSGSAEYACALQGVGEDL
jgi:hypothetical protein